MLSLVAAPLVTGQVGPYYNNMGCPRRLAFDLSSTDPGAKIEWTHATDPTGQVRTPGTAAQCPSKTGSGAIFSADPVGCPHTNDGGGAGNRAACVAGNLCPTNGVPFGMNHVTQYDQSGIENAGYAPFSPAGGGTVRIKNVATDNGPTNNGKVVDMIMRAVPDAQMFEYTTSLLMGYNGPVMPWNNDVPATQFSLSAGGLIGMGFGVRPADCPAESNRLVTTTTASRFCNIALGLPRGHGAEYEVKFVYADGFTFANAWDNNNKLVPPLDAYQVTFWDVDGDRVDNSLGAGGSDLADIAGVPPVAQDNGKFPDSIVLEELQEVQAVRSARQLLFTGGNVISATFALTSKERYIFGQGPPAGNGAGNVQTVFTSNPYRDITAAFEEPSRSAVGIYEVPPNVDQAQQAYDEVIARGGSAAAADAARAATPSGFKLLVGGIGAVGRQYRTTAYAKPYGLRPLNPPSYLVGNNPQQGTIDFADGPFPKRQNDRGFLMSVLYPEPVCKCKDPCPQDCLTDTVASPAPQNCARNPNCECPNVCKGANPPAECGSSPKCPPVDCPVNPTVEPSCTGPLAGYYSYCKTNPKCPCPSACSGCGPTCPHGTECFDCSDTCAPGSDCTGCSATCPPGSTSATAGCNGLSCPTTCSGCLNPAVAGAYRSCAAACTGCRLCSSPTCNGCASGCPAGTMCTGCSATCPPGSAVGAAGCQQGSAQTGIVGFASECPAACSQCYDATSQVYSNCGSTATTCTGCDTGSTAYSGCPNYCNEYSACILSPGPEICGTPLPPPFPPPFPPLPCHGWCNPNTCGHEECKGCSMCDTVAAGQYCASWCNAYTCASEHELCQGCAVCNTPATSATCHSWCSAYTCFGSCTSCSVCGQVASASYCASWCNAYTCGGLFSGLCGGCSECAEVSSNSYCANWCNAYTCGGIFSGLCGGCSECA